MDENGAWKIRSSHRYKKFKNRSLNINLGLKNTLETFFFDEKRFCVKINGKFFIFKVVATGDGKNVLLINKKRLKNGFKTSPWTWKRAETYHFRTINVFFTLQKVFLK